MLIYVDQITERLLYIKHFLFDSRAMKVTLTNDKSFFIASENINKLNYSFWSLDNIPHLEPSVLLFEERYREKISVKKKKWFDIECLEIDGVCDPLASVFYVLSRYEEYAQVLHDEHDRFPFHKSILHDNLWIENQIIEHWFHQFLKTYNVAYLEKWKSELITSFIPSFDIDNTFAFQWKNGWRSWLSSAKDVFTFNFERLKERRKVLRKEKKDPYDSYDEIQEVCNRNSETLIFWLLGDFSKYDKNISWSDPRHQSLIKQFARFANLGLHPSYGSNNSDFKLREEKRRIEVILNKKIDCTRQHFLKITFPHTYKTLVENGFKNDYSMGFSDHCGFRAGTAHPHFFFDIIKNERTDLMIHPFVYMDGTFNQYMKLSIDQAKQKVLLLSEEVKKYGGDFIVIWHNESFAESGIWKHWREVFDYTENCFKDA